MRTLALHTLSTHTAHYTAVTSRETRGNGRLAYTTCPWQIPGTD